MARRYMRVATVLLPIALMPTEAAAWDGVDSTTGAIVEIDRGTLVRPGRDIDVYDYDASE